MTIRRLFAILVVVGLSASCGGSDVGVSEAVSTASVSADTGSSGVGADVTVGADASGVGADVTVGADASGVGADLTVLRDDFYALMDMVATAQMIGANDCMARLGFERLPIILPPSKSLDSSVASPLSYLSLDREGATSLGYSSARASQRTVDPREAAQTNLDPNVYDDNWYDAWFGPDESLPDPTLVDDPETAPAEAASTGQPVGCFEEAEATVADAAVVDELQSAAGVAESLWNDVFYAAESDDLYVEALARWRSCMQTRGFKPFETLLDAFMAGRELTLRTGSTTQEIEQAIHDADCQRESAVVETHATVWATHQLSTSTGKEALALYDWHRENFGELTERVTSMLGAAGYA